MKKRIVFSTIGAVAAVAAVAACGGGYGQQGSSDAGRGGRPVVEEVSAGSGAGSGEQGAREQGLQPPAQGGDKAQVAKVLKVTRLRGFSPVVTSAAGRTVYRFDSDSSKPSRSSCVGGCLKKWEPVLAGSGVSVQGGGIDVAKLGTLARAEGQQVTLKGWPLYYFRDDVELGETAGHGTGGVWFAVSPAGGKAKKAGEAAPPVKPADKDVQTVTVNTVDGFMSFVTSGTGRVMYRFDNDSAKPSTTTCFDKCAKTWEPVLAGSKGFKVVGKGVKASDVGVIERPEGRQLTLKGWPLYYFHKDKKLGEVSGYGTNDVWFPIAPNGKKALKCS